jgi:hypothetical protein
MHALGISPKILTVVCVVLVISGVVLAATGVITVLNALVNTALLSLVGVLNWRRMAARG